MLIKCNFRESISFLFFFFVLIFATLRAQFQLEAGDLRAPMTLNWKCENEMRTQALKSRTKRGQSVLERPRKDQTKPIWNPKEFGSFLLTIYLLMWRWNNQFAKPIRANGRICSGDLVALEFIIVSFAFNLTRFRFSSSFIIIFCHLKSKKEKFEIDENSRGGAEL